MRSRRKILGADDVRVLARGGHGLQVFVQRIKARFERRERVANFMRNAGRQRAERGQLFLPFDQTLGLNLHLLQALAFGNLGSQCCRPPLHRLLQILIRISQQSLRLGQ